MIKLLLPLSLVVIPFYELILYLFMPGRSMPSFGDMRVTKDFVMMAFASTIGVVVLWKYGFKPFKDKWLLAFMVFLVWNIFKIPNALIPISGVNVNGIWNHWPAYQSIVLFLFFLGLINVPYLACDRIKQSLYNVMAICGAVMSVYMIIQFIGMDQVMHTHGVEILGSTKAPKIGGTIGQPTLCAPFILATIPLMILRRHWVSIGLACIAVCLSQSSTAFVVLFLLGIAWAGYADKQMAKKMAIFAGFLVICVITAAFSMKWTGIFSDNGRFVVWQQSWNDITSNINLGLTGAGIGAYKFLFALKRGNTWYAAHNDYLQLLWTCGLIGTGLIGMFIYNFIKDAIKVIDREIYFLLLSIFALMLSALTSFVFQLAVYQYYFIVLLGLIYSLRVKKEILLCQAIQARQ